MALNISYQDSLVKDDITLEVRTEDPSVSSDHLVFNIQGTDMDGDMLAAGLYLNEQQVRSLVDHLNGWLTFKS